MTEPLLEVEDLVVDFRRPWRRSIGGPAVAGVTFSVGRDETLALVGESGSGKTTVARTVVGLQRATSGIVRFDGVELGPVGRRDGKLKRDIQMVFQDPRSSLNPRMTVRAILSEVWATHRVLAPADPETALVALLGDVGLDPSVLDRRPADLSGGQCQRVSIARALAMQPRLLVCDEAVSALDVSVQAQILRLLVDLKAARGISILFISHDLGVVRQIADRVAVMRRGELVEVGDAERVFAAPGHPYTGELLAAALDLIGAGDRG